MSDLRPHGRSITLYPYTPYTSSLRGLIMRDRRIWVVGMVAALLLALWAAVALAAPVISNPTPPPSIGQGNLNGPPVQILINGTWSYQVFHTYAGQHLVLVLDIQATQPTSVTLSIKSQTPGGAVPAGITLSGFTGHVEAPVSVLPLSLDTSTTLSPGVYHMAIDATVKVGVQVDTFQAGFDLVVSQS
jgi:hypothetical protein